MPNLLKCQVRPEKVEDEKDVRICWYGDESIRIDSSLDEDNDR